MRTRQVRLNISRFAHILTARVVYDWTGRLYRDELIFQAADNFRCLEADDNCAVAKTCEEFFLSNGPWIALSIHNVWRIMRAQIKGYDRAIEKFDEK
jgi:hypothetical protein